MGTTDSCALLHYIMFLFRYINIIFTFFFKYTLSLVNGSSAKVLGLPKKFGHFELAYFKYFTDNIVINLKIVQMSQNNFHSFQKPYQFVKRASMSVKYYETIMVFFYKVFTLPSKTLKRFLANICTVLNG